MLTNLFSSSVRVKVLKFLAMHDNKSYSAADIARKTGSVVRSINKELAKLVETEAVAEETKPQELNKKIVKVKHYRINSDFVIYNEIKSLFVKLQVLDFDDFKEKLKKAGKINYVVLSGKFVGDSRVSVDLLVVGGIAHKKCEGLVRDFEKKVGFEINWTLMPLEEYDYRQKIGDMFLYNLLTSKKIDMLSNFV